MTDKHEQPAHFSRVPNRQPANSSQDDRQYDHWFDGLLDDAGARRARERVEADPAQRARFEADRAIEASLRRGFQTPLAAKPSTSGREMCLPLARPSVPWARYAAAAGVFILIGAALAIRVARRDSTHGLSHADTALKSNEALKSTAKIAGPEAGQRLAQFSRTAQASLGDVFLDALALDFQPLLGCRAQDPWDVELFAQLAEAPCNRAEGVVVLGEWVDPRLDVANMLMLRRGENPIMLVVPRCEQEMELCVSKDSGLYVHRGMRDGRAIFEISPAPGSEVLGCVAAQDVVTQQQL